jgi:hypothetical protein
MDACAAEYIVRCVSLYMTQMCQRQKTKWKKGRKWPVA